MAKEVTFKLNLKVDGKNVIKDLTVDVDELKKAIDETEDSSKKFAASLINFNQQNEAIKNVSGAMQQLSETLGKLTEDSRSFGGAMAAANTMAGKSGEDFANLKDQVAELSKTIPIARDELANGLYQVISNGVPEDNWIEYLQQSAKASVGGIADLGETVKVTSTIIKNYGLQWSDAGSIQDKIQLTAKNGVTSFEQLAQALPRVTSQASTLGVSIDELMATFSTLTGVSGNTAEVSTQLAAIFTALIKPSSEAAEMAQQMGIQFDAASIKAAGGMEQFLQSLDKSVKQYAASSGMLEQEIYGKLFGSAESLRALTPLTNQLADKFRENVSDMKNSAGTIDDAFGTMSNTGSATLQMLNNKFGEFSDIVQSSIGNILPYLNFGTQLTVTAACVSQLAVTMKSLGVVTVATTAAVKAYNTAIAISASVTAAPFLALAAGLGVVAAGYVGVRDRMEDADHKARELRERIADLKRKHEEENKAIREYLTVAQDATKKTKDRKEAIGKLQSLYPNYFKNLDIATAKQYKIADAVNASNKAYRDQLVLIAKQAKVQYEKSKANYEKNQNGGQMGGTTPGMTVMMNQQEKAEVEADKRAWQEAEKAIKEYDKSMRQTSRSTPKPQTPQTPKKQTVSQMNLAQVKKAIEKTETELSNTTDKASIKRLRTYKNELEARKKLLEKETGLDTKSGKTKHTPEPKFYKNPKTIGQLDKNINYYSAKITPNNTAEDQRLRKLIQGWKDKKAAIEAANMEAERPLKLDSIDAYEKDISILRSLIKSLKDTAKAANLQKQLEGEERQLGMLNVKIGIESVPKIEVKKVSKPISEQIKEDIEKLKIKPIHVKTQAEVRQEDFEKISSLFNIDTSNFESVRQALEKIKDISNPTAKGFATAGVACQALGSAMQQLGADSAAAKAGMVIAAIGQIVLSFAQAMMSTSKNWVTWLAFGITGTAQLTSLIATISKFATGGIVGGSQTSGDNVLVRVNSGEMILNAAQQARLFALANGAEVQGMSVNAGTLQGVTAAGGVGGGQLVGKLRGRDLVIAIANETRSNRRRSNIKI